MEVDDNYDLGRFLEAQANPHAGYATATAELKRGRKKSHWIWYVFPQLAGLGRSGIAQRFAIEDVEEALAYLAHPVLGQRLLEITELLRDQLRPPLSVPLDELMGGHIDAVKLVSSLTLFELVALQMRVSLDAAVAARAAGLAACCRDVLDIAGRQGFPACAFTLRMALTGGG